MLRHIGDTDVHVLRAKVPFPKLGTSNSTFPFSAVTNNPLMASDAFIHEGFEVIKVFWTQ